MTIKSSRAIVLGFTALIGAQLIGCSVEATPEESGQTASALEEGGRCWVGGINWKWKLLGVRPANSLAECHDVAFTLGDQYCDGLRAGGSGPNPIRLSYNYEGAVWNGAYQSGTWEFGCAGVPVRK